MKKFVISGIPLCETITGIPRYMYEVLTRIDEKLNEEEGIEIDLCYPENQTIVNYDFKNIRVVPLNRKGKKWVPQVIAPYAKKNNGIVCDMANGFCYVKGTILKIDDVRPAVRHFDSLKFRLYFKFALLVAKKNAGIIVTVSESQKKQIQKFMPHKKIVIFPNGFSHLERFSEENKIFEKFPYIKRGEYYYSLGSIAKHKNYKWIYEMAKKNPDKQFVVAGNECLKKWGTDTESIRLDNVIYIGYVSDGENKALYKNCKALLHPAYYEGFGIPPLEAISMGKNIAVSDIPEFRETYGDNVSYFFPNDYDFDLDSIVSLSDEKRKEILRNYSWDKTAQMWLELLKTYKEN